MHPVQHRRPLRQRVFAPRAMPAALELKAEWAERARFVAGGTDLVVELERGSHPGTEALIHTSRLEELHVIEVSRDVARIGAAVTHSDLLSQRQLAGPLRPLFQACAEIGSPQLRNRATLAGNIVTASPANDTLTALLALGATVRLVSTAGARSVPIEEFVTGFRTVDLRADEIVESIDIPLLGDHQRGVWVKAGNRSQQAISVVHLCAIVTMDAAVTDARLTAGSVAPTVVRLHAAEQALVGSTLEPSAIAAAADRATAAVVPIDDVRATGSYRSHVLRVMTSRALTELREQRHTPPVSFGPFLRNGAGPRPGAAPGQEGPVVTATATVNGTVRSGPADGLLVDWLRDHAATKSVKEGCAEGECGACTVVIDGRAVLSCLIPAACVDGSEVVTVEGLADAEGELTALQQSLLEHGGVQCGFCTPGFVMAATALLDETDVPCRTDIERGLAGNLCRCTGYRAIFDAVAAATVEAAR